MSSQKREVNIQIESISPDQTVIQSVSGDLYLKDSTLYLRYPEPDPTMSGTMTTVKVRLEQSQPSQIKVIRHGTLQSEQTFTEKQTEWGFYHMTGGNLPLETRTHKIVSKLRNGIGTLSWTYDLYVSKDFAGKFEIKLNIKYVH